MTGSWHQDIPLVITWFQTDINRQISLSAFFLIKITTVPKHTGMSVDIKHCNLLFLALEGWPSLLSPRLPPPTTSSSLGLLEGSSHLALSLPLPQSKLAAQPQDRLRTFTSIMSMVGCSLGWIFICF